jgi:MSHA biogenesis protein MshJ
MKRLLLQLTERIDGYSLRERAMVFAAAALLVVGMMDAVLLQPRFAQEKLLAKTLAQRQSEMRELQSRMQQVALARQADPDRESRERLAAAKAALAQVEQVVVEEQKKFTAPEQIRAVLEEMLSRNRRLRLVDLKTLPATTIAEAKAPQEARQQKPAAAKPSAAAERKIFRHGIEITVAGSYLDLHGYLVALERMPSQIYWGSLDLRVAAHPEVTLKLTVYTLSLEKTWLRV